VGLPDDLSFVKSPMDAKAGIHDKTSKI
jgi:hypothetical protein